MTPEKLVDLLEHPKVSAKLVELLDDPRIAEQVAGLLDEPVMTRSVLELLRGPEVRGVVEGYLELAVTGAVVLGVLIVLNLLLALYNTAQLRRLSRREER